MYVLYTILCMNQINNKIIVTEIVPYLYIQNKSIFIRIRICMYLYIGLYKSKLANTDNS